ncbi:type II toxin-antitoxin system prevent-host-death family antitoxin [Candidatus Daviesbacteria bacterium]|nr:type II toxin-antitoxin system prevent-host-death family antitoxin [Candidatus Daviesbacteria bacterium]
MTQVMKASEARQQWSQLLNNVFRNQARVVVEKSGIPIAAVISTGELKRFIQLEEQRKKHFKALDRMRAAFKDVPAKKLEQEISKALAEVRLEKRKQLK